MRRAIPVILTLGILLSWACHERIIVYPPARVPDTSSSQTGTTSPAKPATATGPYSLDPDSPEKSISSASGLDSGEINFRQGKYLQAIQDYEAYLENNPQSELKDRILFNIGLSRVLSPEPDRNLHGAEITLKQLIAEFPDSGYKNPAELILGLIAEVEQLNQDVKTRNTKINRLQEEMNRLKEIDLNRRPSRPE